MRNGMGRVLFTTCRFLSLLNGVYLVPETIQNFFFWNAQTPSLFEWIVTNLPTMLFV